MILRSRPKEAKFDGKRNTGKELQRWKPRAGTPA
jgi:hypothetical protein